MLVTFFFSSKVLMVLEMKNISSQFLSKSKWWLPRANKAAHHWDGTGWLRLGPGGSCPWAQTCCSAWPAGSAASAQEAMWPEQVKLGLTSFPPMHHTTDDYF